jgi:3-hydroxybutyryl-CoA dehydrogenase
MSISHVAVVGTGTMSSGIIQVVARAGIPAVLVGRRQASLDLSVSAVQRGLQREVERGRISDDDRALAASLVVATTEFDAIRDADCIIECVVEDIQVKLQIFGQMDDVAKPSAILASNTSSISITQLASATARADRVVGMHFFNPPQSVQLIEIVRGLKTSDQTVAEVTAFARQAGKTPVEVNDSPGFVSNRIVMPMINEAIYCLMEGVATREAIDDIMKLGLNHPMGPLALADLVGLDVCLDTLELLHREFGDQKYRPCPLLRMMVRAGELGRKSGEGFYTYSA